MTTRIAPIAAAGVAGLLVGYLLAPDVGAVREDFAARFNEQTPLLQQMQASVAAIEARVGTLPDGAALSASVQEQLSAAEGRLATQTQAVAAQFTEQGGTAPEELTVGLDDLRSQVETIGEDIASLREEMSSPAASAPAEDEAGTLAEEIGASGAVLLPGQAALFGGNRIDLSELDIDAGTATLTAEGGEPQSISAGESFELSQTCTVRLAGVASNAAYLAPQDCAEGAQPASAQDQPAQAETAPTGAAAVEPAPASDPAGQPAEGDAPTGGQQPGTDVPVEGAQAVPDQQPGQQNENAPNAGQPQGGQPSPVQ